MESKTFIATAPSKLILAGEHLVVYGFPGIAIPLADKLTTVELKLDGKSENWYQSELLKGDLLQHFLSELPLFAKVINLNEEQTEAINTASFRVELGSPPGVGLGASASFAVAMIKVIAAAFNINLTTDQLLQAAAEIEKHYHGNPSGIDHTTIIYNKPVYFKKGTPVEVLDFDLPDFWHQHVSILNTGKPTESTKQMVEKVASLVNSNPDLWHSKFKEISNLVPALLKSLQTNNYQTFKDIINQYGLLLEELGVVSQTTIEQSAELRAKQKAVKVCGAGGQLSASGTLLICD